MCVQWMKNYIIEIIWLTANDLWQWFFITQYYPVICEPLLLIKWYVLIMENDCNIYI